MMCRLAGSFSIRRGRFVNIWGKAVVAEGWSVIWSWRVRAPTVRIVAAGAVRKVTRHRSDQFLIEQAADSPGAAFAAQGNHAFWHRGKTQER
jgi:hypothetical protein